jgi:hypothetical protein
MYMHKLGGGYNAGYADLKILNLNLIESTIKRYPKITSKNDFTIEEEVVEEALPDEFTDALSAWKKYLENIDTAE